MHKVEYINYLKSEDWKERRKILMQQANYKCMKCGEKATQLHHLNYNNIGNEILEDDVIALCSDCHKEIHGKGQYGEHKGYRGYY